MRELENNLATQSRQPPRPALSRESILAHLAAHPGDTKRDLARALAVKGAERKVLKQILAEMAEEGAIERGRKRSLVPAGALPEVAGLVNFGGGPPRRAPRPPPTRAGGAPP